MIFAILDAAVRPNVAHFEAPIPHGVPATDGLSLVAAEIVLLLTSAVACWIPVQRTFRATLIDVVRAP